jgi:CheY-like chemotaxis protein
MHQLAASDELTDADFGKLGREMSLAARLPKAPVRAKPAPAKARKTILVVDDDAETRKLVRGALEGQGYSVLEATSGHEALDALRQHVPDLVVADAMLPDIHGFDIAKRMKGTERYGNIPIVMTSAVHRGWRFAEDLKASYGVQAYIEKPFKIADLLEAVQAALEQRPPVGNVSVMSSEAERMLTMGIDAYQKGQLDQAVVHLREGTRIDPLAYRLHFHLGLLYGKQDKIFDAIQELEAAVAINGRHFAALKNLAVLYQKAGFRNKAIETWEHAVGVAPDDATRQSIKEHLVGLL